LTTAEMKELLEKGYTVRHGKLRKIH
jgi:hypothetical protein